MKKNVTIKDIARELGVHHTTVSLALRNSASIKEETRKRVQDKAREMGYRPNRLAQGFRNRRSHSIGVIVPNIQHHFFAKFISELSQIANNSDYSVMVFQSNEKLENEKRNLEALLNNRVAGVIASISKETRNYDHFDELGKEGIPLVFFDRVLEDSPYSMVLADNYQGAFQSVNRMVEAGRKRIAFITGSSHINVYRDRLEGYRDALAQNQLAYDEEMVILGGFTLEDGIAGARQLMQGEELPDAILAVGDDVGIGAIKYLKSAGYRVPEDVCVIGFDNDPMGRAIDPELTTRAQPVEEMAMEAWRIIQEQIQSDNMLKVKKVFPTTLLERRSG